MVACTSAQQQLLSVSEESARGAAAPALLNASIHAQGSRSLSKRKREVETEEQVEREARQLRREMRMRGHVVGPHRYTVETP